MPRHVSWLIRDVGLITASFSADFLRYVTGDPRALTDSQVGATVDASAAAQRRIQTTDRTTHTASAICSMICGPSRSIGKTFSVQVASAYYAVLGNRDTVRNNFLNLLSSRQNAERTRELAREGRVTQSDLGRLEQQVLTTESAWINALRSYTGARQFQIAATRHRSGHAPRLDDAELRTLEILDPQIKPDDAVQIGLTARLDYLNSKTVTRIRCVK